MALCDGCQNFRNRLFDPERIRREERITIHKNFAELSACADTFCDLCRFIRRELCYYTSHDWNVYQFSDEHFQDDDRDINANLWSNSGDDGASINSRVWVFRLGQRDGSCRFMAHNKDGRDNPSVRRIRGDSPRLDSLLQLSREWLAVCRTCHTRCRPQAGIDSTFLPTRLLDIGQSGQQTIRLTISEHLTAKEAPDYVTLSYCWGKAYKAACTTKENLTERLEAILITSLPKTLRDAVDITRAFGVRYLWVDALCIIQANAGENEDWQNELPNMGKIYKHSLFTIAASGAKDSSVGCFYRREAACWPVEDCYLFDENRPYGPHNPVILKPTLPEWNTVVEESVLAKRGWVLQERMFASRTLFWTEDGLFWECNEMNASEYQAEEPGRMSDNPTWIELAQSSKENEHERGGLSRMWLAVLSAFSEKTLTVSKDKVPAIAGLGWEISRLTGWVFEMGVFKHNLVRELAWTADFTTFRQGVPVDPQAARLPGIPSWSWASTNNNLDFPSSQRKTEELATAAFVNAHQLRVRGRLGSLRVKKATGNDLSHHSLTPCIFVPVRATGRSDMRLEFCEGVVVLDTLADTLPEEGGTIRCIQWLKWDGHDDFSMVTGALIVSPVDEEKNIYRRIGWLQVRDADSFEEEFQDIILV